MAAGDVTFDVQEGQAGMRFVTGKVQLDGGNPTPVNLAGYLSTLLGGVCCKTTSTTPTVGAAGVPYMFIATVNALVLEIRAFANTAMGDATPIASTEAVQEVNFIAWGRRK